MPFKIVKTAEADGDRLSIVPSFWEYRGILSWPPKSKNILKLIKDDRSKPNNADWKKHKCEVKRQNLLTYAQAEIELDMMERQSETDINEPHQETTDPSPANIIETQIDNSFMDFDNYASALTNDKYVPENTSVNNASNTEEVVLQVCEDQNLLSDKIDRLVTIINNQNKIIQNMANKMCIMSVQLEQISEQISQTTTEQTVTLLKDVRREETESFSFNMIEQQRQLDALEMKLSDKYEYKKLKRHLSFLCSPTPGGGKTCAYRLLDIMLSREFLCLCSWSGGSRGEISKIALKDYKLFRKFFYDMVHSWDDTFTLEDSESFIKAAIRNSGKRKLMRDLRASKPKRRKNKNPAKNNNDSTTKQDENNIQSEKNKQETEEEQKKHQSNESSLC